MTTLFLSNLISILVEKSLNSYDYLFNRDLLQEELNGNSNENFIIEQIEKPSKATMNLNENGSNNESLKSLQKTHEEKKVERKRKEIIQMNFHRIFCKNFVNLNNIDVKLCSILTCLKVIDRYQI